MISVFDIYKIGLGPSSSHTFGTMVASNMFRDYLIDNKLIVKVCSIDIHLYGSLALTGYGHGTCLSIELGLEGYTPNGITPQNVAKEKDRIYSEQTLILQKDKNGNAIKIIPYKKEIHRQFHYEQLPYHSNGLKFVAFDELHNVVYENTYYSVGGGFVLTDDDVKNGKTIQAKKSKYEFKSFAELMKICQENQKTIYDIILENELENYTKKEIDERVKEIVAVMNDTIENGLSREGLLQGIIKLPYRASVLKKKLEKQEKENKTKSNDLNVFNVFDYVNMWALAVSEENASFGRVITAPTNGACGVIPAVIKFIQHFQPELYTLENLKKFIFVSAVIGILCKMNATISGAEGGCQAEIGSACAMASAGLTALYGGTDLQIENSAVIGLVHNFGLTCDPVAGFVQVPCIERNAVNAIKAIHASRMAMMEEKSAFVRLDSAILTMKQCGDDMHCKYRETSQGGLAVNCPLS